MSLRQTRIDNMIIECELPGNEIMQNAVGKLLDVQPKAIALRYEGKCDVCRRDGYLSYIHPDFVKVDGDYEDCGWFCHRCGFSNAGAREVLP